MKSSSNRADGYYSPQSLVCEVNPDAVLCISEENAGTEEVVVGEEESW